ncbi:MAG: helix-turn-helix domain-containing protein, partial [Planctomycetaceae bacterium]|nr:helix-turn-helix domain-containing protein [Planctomycetaceae bacterium]
MTLERYTTAMFAELLEVSPAMVRQWHRRGWLRESEVVQKLAYFALTELLPAKRLAQLAKNGLTNAAMAKKLDALQALFPDIDRPIAALDLRIDGRAVYLTKHDETIDPFGQKLFDFAEKDLQPDDDDPLTQLDQAFYDSDIMLHVPEERFANQPRSPKSELQNLRERAPDKDALCRLAWRCEEQGRLEQAVALIRAALAAGGPDASLCFQLGDLLYRLDDNAAARERYYMAIEIDEN